MPAPLRIALGFHCWETDGSTIAHRGDGFHFHAARWMHLSSGTTTYHLLATLLVCGTGA